MPFNWWPFSKIRYVKCGDGSTKSVYKRPDDAIPLYIPGWQTEATAKSSSQALPGQLSAKVATQIHGLLVGLDELNQGVMLDFRLAYMVYANDPCRHSDFFERQVEKMIDAQGSLREKRLRIQGVVNLAQTSPSNSTALLNAVAKVLRDLGQFDPPAAARAEIESAREQAQQWIGGSNAG